MLGPENAETWNPASDGTDSDGDLIVVGVRHLGEEVGDVAVRPSDDRPLSTGDRRLLAVLAAQAGPALRGVIRAEQLQATLLSAPGAGTTIRGRLPVIPIVSPALDGP